MNIPSKKIHRKNLEIEKRLSKLEGRHLRMLNRISYKIAKEESSKDVTAARRDLYNFIRNPQNHQYTPLLIGVRSALYSKLDGSIKNTVFNNANLGLVITNGDVKTNYDIEGVQNFMTHGKIENYCPIIDGIDNSAFSGINIVNSGILRNSENKNATIGKNSIIIGTDLLEHSNNEMCTIGLNSIINYSRIDNHSKNSYAHVAENAVIISSLIGNYNLNEKSSFAKNAIINDLNTIINKYSNERNRKWWNDNMQYKYKTI